MKSFGRVVVAASAAVAFTAGSAVVAPVVGAAPGSADLLGSLGTGSLGTAPGGPECGEHVVTPATLEASGWFTPDDENPAVIGAAPGEAPDDVGDSALTFPTENKEDEGGNPTGGSSLYKNVEMPIADLLDEDGDGDDDGVKLSFDYTANGQAPALQIRLNDASLADSEKGAAGYEDGFATIVWSPDPANGNWATADANLGDTANQFWVTRALQGDDKTVTRGERKTLKEIVDLNPNAKIVAYGVQRTRDNTSTDVAIDNFTFGCETTNFELPAEDDLLGSVTGSLGGDTGSLAVGGLLAVGAGVAAAVFAAQNGLIQIPGL